MENIKGNYLNAGKQMILSEPNALLDSKTILPFFLRKGHTFHNIFFIITDFPFVHN